MNQRHLNLLRIFPWHLILRMRIAARIHAWANNKITRRGVAVRDFTWFVPPSTVSSSNSLLTFSFPIRDISRNFALRINSSDLEVFLQIIRDGEYEEAVRHMPRLNRPPRIVDAGANIGLTTLYLKTVFPEAEVLALEPQPENFHALTRTIALNELSSVTPLCAGLWSLDTALRANAGFRDGEAWSFSLSPVPGSDQNGIPVLSLKSLLDHHDWSRVDLLKIDIEGGEASLMRDAETVRLIATRVSLLCMEVHSEVISMDEVRQTLAAAGMKTFLGRETLLAWPDARS